MLVLPCPAPSTLILTGFIPVRDSESFILDYDEKYDITEPVHRYNT
jgi:hypothetical protein